MLLNSKTTTPKAKASAAAADDDVYTNLKAHLQRYTADDEEAFRFLHNTVCIWLGWMTLYSIYPSALLGVGLSLSLVRWFIIFHDACHMSFFTKAYLNRLLVTYACWLVHAQPSHWRRIHQEHHHVIGQLDDATMTVHHTEAEFEAMPPWRRRLYRVARDPLLFPWLVSLVFTLWRTLPGVLALSVYHARVLQVDHPYARALFIYWLAWFVGVSLFHLQHQVNAPYRVADGEDTDAVCQGAQGSTFLAVPSWLKWATGSIEYHHIHHLNPMVPCYHLRSCHEEFKGDWEALGVRQVSYERSALSMFHTLYEGDGHERFTTFWPYKDWGLWDNGAPAGGKHHAKAE